MNPVSPPELILPEFALQVLNLVNAVYASAEADFWEASWKRTHLQQIQEAIGRNELFGLFSEAKPIACIQLTSINSTVYEFGMLSTHPDFRRQKLGAQLVQFVEQRAIHQGAEKMQLHLLQGKIQKNELKSKIEDWYTRMGYVFQGHKEIHDVSLELAEYLKQSAHFLFFEKKLTHLK